jgi:hypothetical protein
MHNYLSYDRKLIHEIGSEDCMGRTLWACGYYLDPKLPEATKLLAKDIFDKVFRWTSSFTSPRAKAVSIMGLFHYQKANPEDQNVKLNIEALANQLTRQFELESSKGWDWFESCLTYSMRDYPIHFSWFTKPLEKIGTYK